jgi:CDP-diacylglycerol---serine O-phosphatidyltransferase
MHKQLPPSNLKFLLPNMITACTLFFGFFATVTSSFQSIALTCFTILLAAIADALDGKVAKLTNTESNFGQQFDSLADLIAFGIAPAALIYHTLRSYSPIIAIANAFMHLLATAIRLAKFNLSKPSTSWKGMPCPSSAAVIITFIWLFNDLSTFHFTLFLSLLVLVSSILQLSSLPFYGFKSPLPSEKFRYLRLISLLAICCAIPFNPPLIIFSAFLMYMILSPIYAWIKSDINHEDPDAIHD